MSRQLRVLALTLGCLLACAPTYALESRAENAAMTRLTKTLMQDARYRKQWPKLRCLDFFVEETTKTYIEIAVHERHGGKCAGDPVTEPVVDRFRVPAGAAPLQIYDPIDVRFLRYRPAKR